MKRSILVPNVDLELLSEQRGVLMTMVDGVNLAERTDEERDAIDGLINLIDAMLDIAYVGKIM